MNLLKKKHEDDVWYMRYRPDTIEQLILPPKIKKSIIGQRDSGKIIPMILSGPAGMGKTTLPMILAEELNISMRYFNFSKDRSINVIRDQFTSFAMKKSTEQFFDDDPTSKRASKSKMIIGDEFDRLTPEAMDSLKGVIEQCSSNCIFIFTTNHANKIIDPIRSRCMEMDFVYTKEESKKAIKEFFMSVGKNLKNDGIEFDNKALLTLIAKTFPDMRKTWNILQSISNMGEGITFDTIDRNVFADIGEFFRIIKGKDFGESIKFVNELSIDLKTIYSLMFRDLIKYIVPDSLPNATVILSEYQYKSSISVDPEVDLNACVVRLMTECEWK